MIPIGIFSNRCVNTAIAGKGNKIKKSPFLFGLIINKLHICNAFLNQGSRNTE